VRVTVLTPTFNRAHTLPRVFASLRAQTFRDFEWLVVDDGSTDDTPALVDQFARTADFPVRYVRQANAGKVIALNRGVALAGGELCAVLDSDDWYLPEALEVLTGHWDALPDPGRFAEVQALCVRESGELIGTRFPGGEFYDSDAYAIRFQHGVRGDKVGMQRTDVLREFPFPEDLPGATITPALVWHRIANRYRTRYVNRVLGGKEYLEGGITRTGRSDALRRAEPRRRYYGELLGMRRPLPRKAKGRAYVNWARNARLAGVPLRSELREAPAPLLLLAAAPAGWLLAARDRRRAARTA
jgi:glycosyltransferase involved in cell wall biosynthesis